MATPTTWEEVRDRILALGGKNHRRKVEILFDHACKEIEKGGSAPPPKAAKAKKKPKKVENAVVEGADVV